LVFLQENQSLFVLSVVSAIRLQMAMYSLRHCSHSVRSTNICFIYICFFFFFVCCNTMNATDSQLCKRWLWRFRFLMLLIIITISGTL
jgi:hypothetical protein